VNKFAEIYYNNYKKYTLDVWLCISAIF
jgi:hypothetical protein